MILLNTPLAKPRTVAELFERLGNIPSARVLLDPPPGQATVDDVIVAYDRDNRLCELVDGTLVEKPMGYGESFIAGTVLMALRLFVDPRNLGIVTGEAGMMRLFTGLVRIPDVAFVSWSRVPNGRFPTEPVPDLVPDLVVEVLSESNTGLEMARKREEYFAAGVRLVWMIDPASRSVAVYTAPDASNLRGAGDELDGADVLPGFKLPIKTLFAHLD